MQTPLQQQQQQQRRQQPATIQACQQQVETATSTATAAGLLQGQSHVHLAALGCIWEAHAVAMGITATMGYC
jgi:hypothetical protein